jgi:hypothetical protein
MISIILVKVDLKLVLFILFRILNLENIGDVHKLRNAVGGRGSAICYEPL